MQESNNIQKLLNKYFKRNINKTEFIELKRNIASLSDNELATQLENTWNNYSIPKHRALNNKLTVPALISKSIANKRQIMWKRIFAASAAVLLLFVVTQQILHITSKTETKHFIVKTQVAQRSQITLSDGSTVELNNATQLTYDSNFGTNKREIELNGEAFFNVAKDQEREFIVKNKSMNITVTGTAFNVVARNNSKQSIVTLVEGSVNITTAKFPNKTIALKANEKAIINNEDGLVEIAPLNKNVDIAWRNGEFSFQAQTLIEVLDYIKTTKGVSFKINGTPSTKRFTGRFAEGNINDVMQILALHYNFEYSKNGNTIEITIE